LTGKEILNLLRRDDKWFVSGGKGGNFAPEFPKYPDAPGYWHTCYWADQRFPRLYTLFLLDRFGNPVRSEVKKHEWRPDRHTRESRVTETRCLVPNDLFASVVEIPAINNPDLCHIILWAPIEVTDINGMASLEECRVDGFGAYAKIKLQGRAEGESLWLAFGGGRRPDSYCVSFAESATFAPEWRLTPMAEKFQNCRLPNTVQPLAGKLRNKGVTHIALHWELQKQAGEAVVFQTGCSISPQLREVESDIAMLPKTDLLVVSERNWASYFEQFPKFTCSNEYLQRYYYYRLYGLKLCNVDVAHKNYPFPCVFEGIGYFRRHIGYSAQCHAKELRWMADAAVAEGCLFGLFQQQLWDGPDAGKIPGAVSLTSCEPYIYHADWGGAVLDIYSIHRNKEFLDQVYPHLVAYADWMKRVRDPEDSWLFDVVDQAETGQEFNPRYLAADPDADDWREFRTKLKGVDATVYQYRLYQALAAISEISGQDAARADFWRECAAKTKDAVNAHMWDAQAEMYYDCTAGDLKRISVMPLTSFYPFWTDIPEGAQWNAIRRHLLNPGEFWTEYPAPTLSQKDPLFCAEPEWKGKRKSCPWNGRVWPMANSHIAEVLANASEHDPSYAPYLAQFVHQFIKMMHYNGDPKRPNCYEHYNPHTGYACEYRGVDDYQHSWVLDLILKYVCGLRLEFGKPPRFAPIDFGVDFELTNFSYQGQQIEVWGKAGEKARLLVSGKEVEGFTE